MCFWDTMNATLRKLWHLCLIKHKTIIIIIINFKSWHCKAVREWMHPVSPKTPIPQSKSHNSTKVGCSLVTCCIKSCNLQSAFHRAIRGAHKPCPVKGWGNGESIISAVSDAIVRSWLWPTATRSSPLSYSAALLLVVYNWLEIMWY